MDDPSQPLSAGDDTIGRYLLQTNSQAHRRCRSFIIREAMDSDVPGHSEVTQGNSGALPPMLTRTA